MPVILSYPCQVISFGGGRNTLFFVSNLTNTTVFHGVPGQANRPEPTLGLRLSLGSGFEKSSAECDARREENEEGNGGCGGEEGGPYVAEHFLLKRRGSV